MEIPHAVGFVSADVAIGIVRVGVFSLGLGVCASLVVVPWLLSQRLRSLFDAIGPTDSWVGSYAFWMTVIGGGEIAGFAITVNVIAVQFADPSVVERLTLYTGTALFVGYSLLLVALVLAVLPRLGIDWDRHGYDRRTVALVTGVVLWYHATAVLLSPYAFDWLNAVSRLV